MSFACRHNLGDDPMKRSSLRFTGRSLASVTEHLVQVETWIAALTDVVIDADGAQDSLADELHGLRETPIDRLSHHIARRTTPEAAARGSGRSSRRIRRA
jgi:hypothetical protein